MHSFYKIPANALVALAILFGLSDQAFSACGTPIRATMSPASATLNLGGPVDRNITAGGLIGGWSATAASILSGSGCTSSTGWSTWGVSSYAPSTLTVVNGGLTYPVYQTEVSGIGYIVKVKDPNIAGQPLKQTPTAPLWRSNGTGAPYVGVNALIQFVITGQLRPGAYALAARTVGYGWLSNNPTSNAKVLSVPLSYNALTITVTGTTCTVNAGDKNKSVTMPTVSTRSFQGVGSVAAQQAFSIGLSCPAGIALYATMTDANSPVNTSKTLTLASPSTATGIGIQLLANGSATPISYGPDSSVKGNTNQWYIGGSSGSSAINYTIPFIARYIKTATTMNPGTVSALATITFSYQ